MMFKREPKKRLPVNVEKEIERKVNDYAFILFEKDLMPTVSGNHKDNINSYRAELETDAWKTINTEEQKEYRRSHGY